MLKINVSIMRFILISLLIIGCQPLEELNKSSFISGLSSITIENNNKKSQVLNKVEYTENIRIRDDNISVKILKKGETKNVNIYDLHDEIPKDNTSIFLHVLSKKIIEEESVLETLNKKVTTEIVSKASIFKPTVKINFINKNRSLRTSIKLKFNYYTNVVLVEKVFKKQLTFNLYNLENFNKDEILSLLGKPNYIRKEGVLKTWQYHEKNCVVDFFFEEGKSKIIFSDMRSRSLDYTLEQKKCFKNLNLRAIYKS